MCTLAVLVALAGIPKGSTVIVPGSALYGYTQAQISNARACARSRGITARVDRDK